MNFIKTDLEGVYLIETKIFNDERGFFIKTFAVDSFKSLGVDYEFKEAFYTISRKNVVRGMHFQTPPHDGAKLAFVPHGKILDVVLDIRKNSTTYGKYISIGLSSKDSMAIYIPCGFAHGFISKCNYTIVVYMQTAMYSVSHDSGVRWNSFGFDWGTDNPIVSKRDANLAPLNSFKSPF
jgi:dTDP-4-dehydrorhamnose 3,5-epimerase